MNTNLHIAISRILRRLIWFLFIIYDLAVTFTSMGLDASTSAARGPVLAAGLSSFSFGVNVFTFVLGTGPVMSADLSSFSFGACNF